jgi:hypothetical protein
LQAPSPEGTNSTALEHANLTFDVLRSQLDALRTVLRDVSNETSSDAASSSPLGPAQQRLHECAQTFHGWESNRSGIENLTLGDALTLLRQLNDISGMANPGNSACAAARAALLCVAERSRLNPADLEDQRQATAANVQGLESLVDDVFRLSVNQLPVTGVIALANTSRALRGKVFNSGVTPQVESLPEWLVATSLATRPVENGRINMPAVDARNFSARVFRKSLNQMRALAYPPSNAQPGAGSLDSTARIKAEERYVTALAAIRHLPLGMTYECLIEHLPSMTGLESIDLSVTRKGDKSDITFDDLKELFAKLSSKNITSIRLSGVSFKNSDEVNNFLKSITDDVAKKITELDLSGLPLDGVDLSRFTGLTSLRLVKAGFSNAGKVNEFLMRITEAVASNITKLDLSRLPLDGVDPSRFTGLTSLRLFNAGFSSAGKVNEFLKRINAAAAINITKLNLSWVKLHGVDLSPFINLTSLELCQAGFPDANAVQTFLNDIPDSAKANITELNLLGLPLAGVNLPRLTGLKSLNLSSAKFRDTNAVQTFLNSIPDDVAANITELNLSGLPLDGVDLARFTGLKSLSLSSAKFHDTNAVQTFLNSIPDDVAANITELNLSGLPLDGVDLARFTGLISLNLSSAKFHDTNTVQTFLKSIPDDVAANFTELNLSGLPLDGVDLSRFTGLKSLNLSYAKFRDTNALQTFLKRIQDDAAEQITALFLLGLRLDDVDVSRFPGQMFP